MAFKVLNNNIILDTSDIEVNSISLGNQDAGDITSLPILVHDGLGNVTLQNVILDIGSIDTDTLTTDDVSEGSNLYYTDTRVQAVSINSILEDTSPVLGGDLNASNFKISNLLSPILAQDAATKSYVDSAVSSGTGSLTTDDIPEGSNLYYTDQRVQDVIDTNTADFATTSYVDQAEADAISTANAYTDGRETAITTAYETYADQAEADAKSYTDTQIASIGGEVDNLTTDDITEEIGAVNQYYTDSRVQTYLNNNSYATESYADSAADQAEADANTYTDGRETAITSAYQTYADQAEADAKAYTDTRETAITTAYQTYADTAESNANTYTDTRETAITSAYQTYADQAEADAKAHADSQDALLIGDATVDGSAGNTIKDRIDTKVSKAGDTMTGALTLAGAPIGGNDAATKSYVDSAVSSGTGALTTDDVPEGAINEYYTDAKVDARLASGNITTGIITTSNMDVGGNVTIDGDLTVLGTTTTVISESTRINENLLYLNEGGEATITNAVGNGTTVTYTAENSFSTGFTVNITGVNPSSFNVTDATVTAADDTSFTISSSNTDTYVSGGTARGHSHVNVDLGWAGAYDDGSYAHAGLFRDATDGRFKIFDGYTPEPDAAPDINTGHASFSLADFQANEFIGNLTGNVTGNVTGNLTGNVTGNASTATKLATGRTISLTGDVTGTSASFDGTGNVSIAATIAANSVALGTDTTGNYMKDVSAGNAITISHTQSEGSTATINHADTSTQTSVNNSNGTVIQDITLDDYGHITAIGSLNLDGRYYTETEINTLLSGKLDTTHDITLTFNGDVTGSGTITNMGNTTISIAVNNNSHTHDDRYYTETESDARFVNVNGDTMTGVLTVNPTATEVAKFASADPTIGTTVTLEETQATGYSSLRFASPASANHTYMINYGLSHATQPGAFAFKNAYGKIEFFAGSAGSTALACDYTLTNINYHLPVNFNSTVTASTFSGDLSGNAATATKWATARTLSLTGDVTGSIGMDGTANVSINTVVANDSHTHDTRYYTKTESDTKYMTLSNGTNIGFGPTGALGSGELFYRGNVNIKPIKVETFTVGNELTMSTGAGTTDRALKYTTVYNERTGFLFGDDLASSALRYFTDQTNQPTVNILNGTIDITRLTSVDIDADLNVTGEIFATGDVTAYSTSDERLKTNLETISDPLIKLSKINGYTFNWTEDSGKDITTREAGVLAQEVEMVLPEVVADRENGYKAVRYEKMIPLLIEAIKDQQQQIDSLKQQIKILKDK